MSATVLQRIDWIAPPFAGHLLPMLTIARGLNERGVAQMRVLSTPRYGEVVRNAGLEFVPLSAAREEEILRFANGEHRYGGSPRELLRQFRTTVGSLAELQRDLRGFWRWDAPDLVVADSVLPCVGPVAREHGIRWWTSLASVPSLESPDAPPAYLGGWSPASGVFGRARNATGRRAVRLFKRAAHALHRGALREMGLPRVYRADGSEACYSDDVVLGLGCPELEFARSWPAPLHLVGVPLATEHRADAAPDIDTTRPTLLVTVGTHIPWARREALAEARAIAMARPDWCVHFSHGDGQGTLDREVEGVREVSWVPYGPALAGYRAISHHGGAGVTYATLGAGVPALVRPRDFDQHDFAARIEHAGVGIRLRRGVEATLCALNEIERLLPACERLGAAVRARDPVRETARLLGVR